MKPYIVPKPCVLVDVAAAIRHLTPQDFDILFHAWMASLVETYGTGFIGCSCDLEEKLAYFTFRHPASAANFKDDAQDQLWRAIAFMDQPHDPVESNDVKIESIIDQLDEHLDTGDLEV